MVSAPINRDNRGFTVVQEISLDRDLLMISDSDIKQFWSIMKHTFVNIFKGTHWADNIYLFNIKAHFLHHVKAWKALGIFNSGETSTHEHN